MLHGRVLRFGVLCVILGLLTTPVLAENVTVTLTAGDYDIVELDDGQCLINVEDFGNLSIPGKPMLPARVFMIALPPGAEVVNVTVTGSGPIELPGTFRIRPTPPIVPKIGKRELTEKLRQVWRENRKATYSSDATYPEEIGEYLGTGALRKYRFARIRFSPFAYRPLSGKLLFYSSATVNIDCSLPPPGSPQALEVEQLLSDTEGDDRASRLLVNSSHMRQWYPPQMRKKGSQSTYDYVIITTFELLNAVNPLVNWKEDIGYSVRVVTTSWINDNYSGFDLVERIRNFLADKYPASDWGIKYVLIVSDFNTIPMRYCFPDPTNHLFTPDDLWDSSGEVPTDCYYADLTGDWDSDGDGFYGEYGQDDVDFVAEVWVGRIPWNTASTISNICQKIVDFEEDMGNWKSSALLLGAITFYDNEDGDSDCDKTDEAGVMEDIKDYLLGGWSYTTMYEKSGLDPSSYTCDVPLNQSNVVSNWSTSSYAVATWSAHGWSDGAYRTVWSQDNGNGYPEWGEYELNSPPIFENVNTTSLNDTYPSIVFGSACLNAYPEGDNLGGRLLQRGSSSIVVSTRDCWGWMGDVHKDMGGNISCNYYFLHYLIGEEEKVGEALFDSKVYYSNHFLSDWWDNWNLFGFCLYGDPALVREGVPGDTQPPTMDAIAEPQGRWYNTAPSFSHLGFEDNLDLNDGWYQLSSCTGQWVTLFTNVSGNSWEYDGWTVPGFGGLPEGSNTVYFQADDDIGNVGGGCDWSWQFYKDTVPPDDPTDVTSPSHELGIWSKNPYVEVTWTDATDPGPGSGVGGYSYEWDTFSSTVPDDTKDIAWGVGAVTSPALPDGDNHHIHIRSVDHAGNWQSTVHLGPFWIDRSGPVGGTISINGGAESTASAIVSLEDLGATDDLSGMGPGAKMRFSNDGSSWSPPEDYAGSRTDWNMTLPEYGGDPYPGEKTVWVRYRDVVGNWSESFQDDITYDPHLTLVTDVLPAGFVGYAYSETLLAVSGTSPYNWRVTSGSLPEGLSLEGQSGEIHGTPTTAEISHFTVEVTDAEAQTDTRDLSITVYAGLKGDVNGNGEVDIVDALLAVNIFLQIMDPTDLEYWAADCNEDGAVDIIDVLGLVNVVLGLGTCPP